VPIELFLHKKETFETLVQSTLLDVMVLCQSTILRPDISFSRGLHCL